MSRTKFKKKSVHGKEYFFYRMYHKNLNKPVDLYGNTVAELRAKIRNKEYEIERGVTSEKAYLGDYLKKWLDSVHINGKKEGTIHNYYVCYNNHIKGSPIEKIRLKDLNALDIQDYYSKIIDKKGVNVVKSIHKMICPCIRYAFANQKILTDFTRAIKIPSPKKTSTDSSTNNALSIETQTKFVEAIKGATYEVLFLTALNTGLRIGELLALTWKDINFDKKEISVNKQVIYIMDRIEKKHTYKITSPKTKSSYRIVPIPDFLVQRLEALKIEETEKKQRLQNKHANLDLVFCAKLGGYLATSSVRTSLNTILDENKISHFKIHSFRHTYATRLFELGESPKIVQTLMGHSDISMTMNIYTHVLKSISATSAGKMNDLHNEILCTQKTP